MLEIHEAVINASGGSQGLRDEGLLESALFRPQNILAYENVNIFELAAGYAEAIAHNHPFVDGNKRTAFTTASVFLDLNGYELTIDEDILVEMMVNLAEKKIERADVAQILQKHCIAMQD